MNLILNQKTNTKKIYWQKLEGYRQVQVFRQNSSSFFGLDYFSYPSVLFLFVPVSVARDLLFFILLGHAKELEPFSFVSIYLLFALLLIHFDLIKLTGDIIYGCVFLF